MYSNWISAEWLMLHLYTGLEEGVAAPDHLPILEVRDEVSFIQS